MHTPHDSVKTQDDTLGAYAKLFQSGDSRDLKETCLFNRDEQNKHGGGSSSSPGAICTGKKTVDEVMGEKTESAWLIHVAAGTGGELRIVLLFVSNRAHVHALFLFCTSPLHPVGNASQSDYCY